MGKRLSILLIFTAFLSVSCIKNGEKLGEYESYIKAGDQIPQFILAGIDGNLLASGELSGKNVMIVFFTVSCPHCRNLMPVVEEVWQNTKDDYNLHILPVGRGETVETIAGYWESAHYTMPYFVDTDMSVFDKFAKAGVPRIYIFDGNGTATWIAVGDEGITADLLIGKLQ